MYQYTTEQKYMYYQMNKLTFQSVTGTREPFSTLSYTTNALNNAFSCAFWYLYVPSGILVAFRYFGAFRYLYGPINILLIQIQDDARFFLASVCLSEFLLSISFSISVTKCHSLKNLPKIPTPRCAVSEKYGLGKKMVQAEYSHAKLIVWYRSSFLPYMHYSPFATDDR